MVKKKKKTKKKKSSPKKRTVKGRSRRPFRCYLHDVVDPNEEHYKPRRHEICMICAVKLWELAKGGLAFDIRDECVSVTANELSTEKTVVLTHGYEVNLAEDDGLEHLFHAVFGEVATRVSQTPELSEQGSSLVYDLCILELYFVAGQLRAQRSMITPQFLLDEFGVQWDRIAERRNADNDDETSPDEKGRG